MLWLDDHAEVEVSLRLDQVTSGRLPLLLVLFFIDERHAAPLISDTALTRWHAIVEEHLDGDLQVVSHLHRRSNDQDLLPIFVLYLTDNVELAIFVQENTLT